MQKADTECIVQTLRTVPTIVTAHIYCACQGSRARRERNAQQFSSLKTEEVCACCYFCRIIDLTEHFIAKQKSILKHQKLLLQDVTLRAWVLKNPLIGKDQ